MLKDEIEEKIYKKTKKKNKSGSDGPSQRA
jgi:hypothetical protein